jgi:dihydrofolate reductase
MRKLILWNVVTLDGCFEGEKAWDLSFHELVWGPELEALSNQQLREADMLVFGKNTYEGMAEYWQSPDLKSTEDETAKSMNSIRKIVCSQSLVNTTWNNTEIVKDAVTEIAKLKQEGNGPMYIFGSAKLTESLMNANLLDEIRLCIAPIILSKGRHLFTDKNVKHNLKLLESKQLETGGVFVKYDVINL